MNIYTIDKPKADDLAPIEEGVMNYGLAQVGNCLPELKAIHLRLDDVLIGGATGKLHFKQFYLDNLWVAESYRSQGYGRKIHEQVVECARNNDCTTIRLQTLNKKAVELYRKLDYAALAKIENYTEGFDLYHMALKL